MAPLEALKSCGIEVEGPVGHKREIGILNWFFLDPDNYRVEIEARFTGALTSPSLAVRTNIADVVASALQAQLGDEIAVSATPEQFTAFLKTEFSKWDRIIKEAGIKVD